MDAFLFAVGAILPIVLMVALGYLLKRVKLIGEELAKGLN
jgi:predicted permease